MLTDLCSHPLAQHHLAVLRDVNTEAEAFRRASSSITQLLVAEAAKELALEQYSVQTPLEVVEGARICERAVLVPILRAGLGMLDQAMATIPGGKRWLLGVGTRRGDGGC